MIAKRRFSPHPKRWNGQRRSAPVETLSARVFRLRTARGYSVYELSATAGIFVGTIKRLESGEAVDKRVLPLLAVALQVPLCRLVCGEHNCSDRACVPARSVQSQNDGDLRPCAADYRRHMAGPRGFSSPPPDAFETHNA
jgi:transcriptional regulator with XRE-family HTH domain